MKILSLYDGMACGMLAMLGAGVEVERYVAYEVDKYAIQTSSHNFPLIEHKGDVFQGDFTQYRGFDFLVGGSPCTYWSIAQTEHRETTASGIGWDLFCQYVRALHEAKPRYFIYENNKSMSKAIRDSIRGAFGFEEICINSALVSAQNRQRFYWVGRRNDDGSYSKVNIQQPEDRGILLRDILDYFSVNASDGGKAHTLEAQYAKNGLANFVTNGGYPSTGVAEPVRVGCMPSPDGALKAGQANRVYSSEGKSVNQVANAGGGGAKTGLYAVPVGDPTRVGLMPRPDGELRSQQGCRVYPVDGKGITVSTGGGLGSASGLYAMPVAGRMVGRRINEEGHRDDCNPSLEYIQRYEANENPQKTNCLTTVAKDNSIAEPVCFRYERTEEGKAVRKQYEAGEVHHGFREMCVLQPRPDGKTNTLSTVAKDNQIAEPVYLYAVPVEWDKNGIPTRAVSGADGKTYAIYPVWDGQITIKGKTYPMKLVDGYWIIRPLTVTECMRLQTVPEWYDFSCTSATQAKKMLGNGWTVEVITHLIRGCLDLEEPLEDWML